MSRPQVVSREQWLQARNALLEREKAFNRERDALSQARRELPWVEVKKPYRFEGAEGRKTLLQLFGQHSQLIVYHFMYGPDWKEGCPSCSFWADNFNGIDVHLAHRDIRLIAVSRAPLQTLQRYQQRMGWRFDWYSSSESDFNTDFGVSFDAAELASGEVEYNYKRQKFSSEEAPGISVFKRDADKVFHTYSCYSRGLDMLNGAYHYMDLAPDGRNEDSLPWSMAWLRRKDQYED